MSDDKKNRGEPDRSLVDWTDPDEVRYVKEQLKKLVPTATPADLEDAVQRTRKHIEPSEHRDKAMEFAQDILKHVTSLRPIEKHLSVTPREK